MAWLSDDARWDDQLDRWAEDEYRSQYVGDDYCDDDVSDVLGLLDDLMQMVGDFGFDDLADKLSDIYMDFEVRTHSMSVETALASAPSSPEPRVAKPLPLAKVAKVAVPKKPIKVVAVKARPRHKKGA